MAESVRVGEAELRASTAALFMERGDQNPLLVRVRGVGTCWSGREALLVGVTHDGGAIADVDGVHESRDVAFDGAFADEHGLGHLLVVEATGDVAEDLELAGGEGGEAGGVVGAGGSRGIEACEAVVG